MSALLVCVLACSGSGDPTDDLVRTATAAPGVCVHLGCGDGSLTARLAENGNLVVHALESDERLVESARKLIAGCGLYGQATVEPWAARWLPHADDMVNVLVAERPGAVTEAEMRRVLAPGGVAWIRDGESWRKLVKAKPPAMDEWTHWRHGADGNMVSRDVAVTAPTGLRWVAGPPQDAGGKKWYYDHVLVSSAGRNFYVYEKTVVARDAWNGRLLWTREVVGAVNRNTGAVVTSEGGRFSGKAGGRVTKVQPVAVGDRLYAIHEGKIVAMDAATGRTTMEYGTVEGPRELLLDGGRLVVADKNGIRSFAPDSLAPAWEVPGIDARRIVAADGSVFCLVGSSLVTLDAATGKERWRTEDPKLREAATCSYRGGVLAVERSTWMDDATGCGIQVFSGTDGKLLWAKDYKPSMTHYMEARAFFAKGRLWILGEASKVVGLDPQTGRQEKSLPTRGKHCASPVATERFFLAPECDFTDFETGEVTKARMFKSACRMPFIPANGLLYTFPVQCECYPMLRGYMALGKTAPRTETDLPLLKRGVAAAAPAAGEPAVDEWPTYRHDVYRSGSTASPLRDGELKRSWSVELARPRAGAHGDEWEASPFVRGTLTAPVAAGGLVVVAVPHEHRVIAIDAKTGKQSWSFTAGGRIDTPPTLAEGLCVFGSHDGHIYALHAATGEPAWRYRAAPQEARVLAYGQVESLWPVPGSVLVDQGVAYAVAGRHPLSDGGLRAVALRVRTGELLWEKKVDEIDVKNWYGEMLATKKKVGLDFEPVDLFVKDGDRVSMSRWRFDPGNGDFKLAIASPDYEAPGLAVPRGLWSYGIRQTKMVTEKPPAAFHGGKLHAGLKGDSALIVAGGVLVAGDEKGELRIGERRVSLAAAPVPDGLIVAYGRLYAALQDGTLVCLE